MILDEAVDLIRSGIPHSPGVWADIGAGTGMFTRALMQILSRHEGLSHIYAVDKSPHSLWQLSAPSSVKLFIVEADFNNPMDLPSLDGIVMANALHYANDHLTTLKNVLSYLKAAGTFILVEYDTDQPRRPWVPNPFSFKELGMLCKDAQLTAPVKIGSMPSRYGEDQIYAALSRKIDAR